MAFAHEHAGVRTVARFRPPNDRELRLGFTPQKSPFVLEQPGTVRVKGAGLGGKGEGVFGVTRVLGHDCSQRDVFEAAAHDTVRDIFKGFNGTVFAYGQTGAGKSHSMFGSLGDADQQGIIPRAVRAIFECIYQSNTDVEYKLSCSYLEIYKEELRDLLALQHKPLHIRQSPQKGIYVEDLHYEYVGAENEVYDCLHVGNEQRKVGRTNMNSVSSRSHCVFTMYLEQQDPDGTTKQAKFNLVDLAGSEKVRKSGATGETLEEAKKINLSLTCLSQCIHALSSGGGKGHTHVPFRTSKLTRLLQESLGGNSKTTLLVACSPSPDNLEETVATLRFAERCMAIQNEVKANVHLSPEQLTAMVASLTGELNALKTHAAALESYMRAAGLEVVGSNGQGARGHREIGVQFPEHFRLAPHDLRQPLQHALGANANRRTVKNMLSVFEGQGGASTSRSGAGTARGEDEEGQGRKGGERGGEREEDAPVHTTMSWVSAPVTVMALPRERFDDKAREGFVVSMWGCVEALGVERDDVMVTDVRQLDNGALTVHAVIVCDSPLVPDVVNALKSALQSGVIARALQSQGLEIDVQRLEATEPAVEEKGDVNDTPVPLGQHERMEAMIEGVVGLQASNAPTRSAQDDEIDKLMQQQVEDRAELDALRAAVNSLEQEKKALATTLEVKQVEIDATRERLVVANKRLLGADGNRKGSVGDDEAKPRQRRGTELAVPAVTVKGPHGKAVTSRERNEDDEEDHAHKKRGLFDLHVGASWHRKAKNKPVHIQTPKRTVGEEEYVEAQDEERDELRELNQPAFGFRNVPSLQLVSVSGVGDDLPLAENAEEDDLPGPRRREDEELDDMIQKQDDLALTVRRQQTLIERQADALQLVSQRAQEAEQEVLYVASERDALQERVQRLELKLMKHGLVQRRPSVSQIHAHPPSARHSARHADPLSSRAQANMLRSHSHIDPPNDEDERPAGIPVGLHRVRSVKFNSVRIPSGESMRTLGERPASQHFSGYESFRDGRASVRLSNMSARDAANPLSPNPHPDLPFANGSPPNAPAVPPPLLPGEKPAPPPQLNGLLSQREGGRTGRAMLPSQRGGLVSVREGGPLIRKPMRGANNSAVEKARANKEDSVMGGLFQAPQFLTRLFWEDDEDEESESSSSQPNQPKKQASFFGF